MKPTRLTCELAVVAILIFAVGQARAGDWPMWRYDMQRTGASPDGPAAQKLKLSWTLQLPPPVRAEPGDYKLQYDWCDEPVVLGQTLIVASSRTDCITGRSTRSGEVKWRFFTDAPVRVAPTGADGKVYVASEDGRLYCLTAETGELLWQFDGSPNRRTILGHGRLISMWPSRGGPVVDGGRVYHAAGLWPFMGVFIYCLDATTGELIWSNEDDKTGLRKIAPQGPMAISGNNLIVACGRSFPAILDARTGEILHGSFEQFARSYPGEQDRPRAGSAFVAATDEFYFTSHSSIIEIQRGIRVAATVKGQKKPDFRMGSAIRDGVYYSEYRNQLTAINLRPTARSTREVWHKKKRSVTLPALEFDVQWRHKVSRPDSKHNLPRGGVRVVSITAGDVLYSAKYDHLAALDISAKAGPPKQLWQKTLEGIIASLVAADGRLFAMTTDGLLYCFSADRAKPKKLSGPYPPTEAKAPKADQKAGDPFADAEGYGLLLGFSDAEQLADICRRSKAHWIAIDVDAAKVEKARHELFKLGLYGSRVHVLRGEPASFLLPEYLAEHIVLSQPAKWDTASLQRIYKSLRPYGGKLAAAFEADNARVSFMQMAKSADLPGATVRADGQLVIIQRPGALVGAGNWTHQEGNAANTRMSSDTILRAPFSVLWFGTGGGVEYLDRHTLSPRPQVADGRMFIEGADTMTALDIYTGRVLWEREIPGLAQSYKGTQWQPGSTALGSDYVSTSDGVYVIDGSRNKCLKLDPISGQTLATFTAPGKWGTLWIDGDLLIAAINPLGESKLSRDSRRKGRSGWGSRNNWAGTASRKLIAMDRHSGRVFWEHRAETVFRHTAVAIGGGKIFGVDMWPRGTKKQGPASIIALDMLTGKPLWTCHKEVFGNWLGYSVEHDVLIQGTGYRFFMQIDLEKRIKALSGADGSPLWQSDHYSYARGPVNITGRYVMPTGGPVLDIVTGKAVMRSDPLTGQPRQWQTTWLLGGCGGPGVGSVHVMTARANEAGAGRPRLGGSAFHNLDAPLGLHYLDGFRSACVAGSICAGGLMTTPNIGQFCACATSQVQSSVALSCDPDAEYWAYDRSKDLATLPAVVKSIGVNFGAPGDRIAQDNTIYLAWPPSRESKIEMAGISVEGDMNVFYRHSARMRGEGPKWIAGSGLQGAESVKINLGGKGLYTIVLYFAEGEQIAPGERIFNVAINGQVVLKDFDVAAAATGPRRCVASQFKDIPAEGELTVTLTPVKGSTIINGLSVKRQSE